MKKFNWNNPVTRKDYAILCGASLLIVCLWYAIWFTIVWWDAIKSWVGKKVKAFRGKFF